MDLSIKDSLSFGWRTFKTRPWFFVLLSLVVFAASFVSSALQTGITEAIGKTPGSFVAFLISLVINTFVGIGFMSVYLRAHDNVMSADFKDLWHPGAFWRYLGAYVLLMVILVVGYVLLIVPGVILSIMLMFTTVLVIDKGLGPIEALKESARLTKGHRWQLFLFILATIGVNILGAIALLVGLFVSIPVTLLAMIHIYRELAGHIVPMAEPLPEPAQMAA